jgi:histidinol-phosphate aminotransferase
LADGLQDAGLTVVPSEANLVMTVLPSEQEVNRVFEELLAQGVIVRPLKAFGLAHCIRVSTGTDEDNRVAVEALRKSYAASVGGSRAG